MAEEPKKGFKTVDTARRMIMDGLDISTLKGEDVRADLAKEYLSTRRFYAKSALGITLLICVTLTLAFIIFGSKVDKTVVEACRIACQTSNSIMSEVTSGKCLCAPLEDKEGE